MKTKYDKWLSELQNEILLLDQAVTEPLARLRHTLPLISGILKDLKTEILANGFDNEQAEIHFFKHTKPNIYALQIYEADLFTLLMNRPAGTAEMIRGYYEQELRYVARPFRVNAFHYEYYRTGATILDSQYFTRDGKPSDIPVLENIDPSPGFSTPLDYLFAKFIAAERMQETLLGQLNSTLKTQRPKPGPVMRWTGEAINLVELAYGIWLTGQLNHGNATITDIIHWLEQHLAVNIGVAHKRWEQISARTHSEPTKYLDRIRDALLQRIDQERGIRDQKRKARRTG
jgi:hypothetical protein